MEKKLSDINASAVIFVRNPAALDRGLRKLIGLPTLKRSAIACQRLTGRRTLLSLPDSASLELCRAQLGELVEYCVGLEPVSDHLRTQSQNAADIPMVLLLDSDLVVNPKALQKIANSASALHVAAPGGLSFLTNAAAEGFLQSSRNAADFLQRISSLGGKPIYLKIGKDIARLDLAEGRQAANRMLSLAVRCSTDSFLGSLNRGIALPMTRACASVGISPNAVSFLALGLAILGGFAFTQGTYGGFLSGALLTYLSTLLDFSDGDLARLTYRESKFGCWLDSACDYLSYFLTFGGIFVGAYRAQILPGMASLVSILAGLTTSIGVFIFYRIWLSKKDGRPDQLDAHLQNAMRRMADDPGIRLAQMLAKLPTRGDLTYILLGFALLGQMRLFLLFISYAVHVVWILAIYVGWRAKQRGLFDIAELTPAEPVAAPTELESQHSGMMPIN